MVDSTTFIGGNLDAWNSMMVGLVFANLVMFFTIKYIAKIVRKDILYPIIMMMCVVGAYVINYGIIFDAWTLLLFGVGGYVSAKLGIEIASLVIGLSWADRPMCTSSNR